MTDHEPFQREPQNPQDPQVVVFSPELLKLADRRRQALEDCRQAAEDGDANAVVQMGMNCLYGIGGAAKDPEKAFRWFSQTAPDDPAGLYWLGVCYDNGFGVERDEDRPAACIRNPPPGTTPRLCATWACAMKAARGWKRTWKRPWSCTAGRRRGAIPWAGATWA